VVQGQNSRLLPVNSGASLASIANSIFDSVPPGATYTPPASASSGASCSPFLIPSSMECALDILLVRRQMLITLDDHSPPCALHMGDECGWTY